MSSIRSMLQQLRVTSPNVLKLLETVVGQACHPGFYKREGSPRSESLSDSSKVTSKSAGRPEALPRLQPCPRVPCVLKAPHFLPLEAQFSVLECGLDSEEQKTERKTCSLYSRETSQIPR